MAFWKMSLKLLPDYKMWMTKRISLSLSVMSHTYIVYSYVKSEPGHILICQERLSTLCLCLIITYSLEIISKSCYWLQFLILVSQIEN